MVTVLVVFVYRIRNIDVNWFQFRVAEITGGAVSKIGLIFTQKYGEWEVILGVEVETATPTKTNLSEP